MKYIMFKDSLGRKIPFIFPSNFVHSDVANSVKDLLFDSDAKVVSAGEIVFTVDNCNGKSTSLGVGVIKGDTKLINEYDYFFGLPNETGVSITELKELRKIINDKSTD